MSCEQKVFIQIDFNGDLILRYNSQSP